MPFMSHQHPNLGKYRDKFRDNGDARHSFTFLAFFFKNEVCMSKDSYINSVMLYLFFRGGQSPGG